MKLVDGDELSLTRLLDRGSCPICGLPVEFELDPYNERNPKWQGRCCGFTYTAKVANVTVKVGQEGDDEDS